MYYAIWTLTLLTLASSGLFEIPAPLNVSISSRNFIHLLTWEPGLGSPANLSYNVGVYSLWGATWLNVSGCEEVVSPLVCNLTGALHNLKDSYYARVQAKLADRSSAYTTGEAFRPMEHTYLDPPAVSVRACGDSLCVALKPPPSHLAYGSLSYTLTVSNAEDGVQYTLPANGLVSEIKNLEPGRKYCITATIANRNSAYSRPQCTVARVSYSSDREISISLCTLAILVLTAMLLLFYTGFICLRVTLPDTLVSVKPQDVRLLPSASDTIVCALLIGEGASSSDLSAKSQTCGSGDEDEGVGSHGTCGAGYERNKISSPGGSASGCAPLSGGHFPPSEPAGYRDVSLTGTSGPDWAGFVTDRSSPLSALKEKGPDPATASTAPPPSECATDDRPFPLTSTGRGPPSAPAVSSEARLSTLTAGGPRRASGEDAGPVGVRESEGRPSAGLTWDVWVDEEEEEEEEGSGVNVNLFSVILAGQEEEEEEEEEAAEEEEEEEEDEEPEPEEEDVNKHRTLFLGVSSDPLLTEPPTHKPAPEEEEEEYDDKECSSYSRFAI